MSSYYPLGQQGGLWLQRQPCNIKTGSLILEFCLRTWSHLRFVCFVTFFYTVHLFSCSLITRKPQLVNKSHNTLNKLIYRTLLGSSDAVMLENCWERRERFHWDSPHWEDTWSNNWVLVRAAASQGFNLLTLSFTEMRNCLLLGIKINVLQPWNFGWSAAVGTYF